MEFNRPACGAELAELERVIGAEPVAHVHALGRRIGLPASLAELGIARADLRGMAEASAGIKRLVDNNPRPLDADALERILDAAWHGEPARLAAVSA
jgi:alcohol dehydrogenase